MKRSLPVPTILICMVIIPIMTFAQDNLIHVISYPSGEMSPDRGDIRRNVPLNEINIRAYRHFKKRYPQVEGESWLKTEDGYIVSFVDGPDSTHSQAHFDLRGDFLYLVKYYPAVKLDTELKGLIRKKYPDYLIDVVTEISDGEKMLYLIIIENSSSVKTLSVIDGKLEVYEELINGGINNRLLKN